ncbi:MAG: amidase [Spirulina sp. SIO3F2]|nr:amidase [Spirulina sp. SIO3F2]
MDKTAIAFASAIEQAQWIRQGELSPLELTQLCLERIAAQDGAIGSFFTVLAEAAIAEAQTKTEQLAQKPEHLPPFFGVPTAIKDLNAMAGVPFSLGVAALRENPGPVDDGMVQRLRAAGFTLLGKTATCELGLFPTTEAPGFPPTRNPWNRAYTSGGSSGGAAAAVAAGFCAVAQGSDGGGSIRTPASCCGLVGLKPARGRVTHAPLGYHPGSISTNGMLTRTVADAAALLDIISGYVTGDPFWLPSPEQPYAQLRGEELRPLKIAWSDTISPIGQAAPICQAAVAQTVQQLESLGHHLEPSALDVAALQDPFKVIWQASVCASGLPLEILSPIAQWLGQQAGSLQRYFGAIQQMQIAARQLVGFFEQYDALLLPVHLHSPLKIGALENLPFEETLEQIIHWIAPCPLANATGLPAIALPALQDEQGLPIGIQIVGKPADEATLIQLALQLEAVNNWPTIQSLKTYRH